MKDKNHIEIATNNEDILEANKIAEEVGCDKAVYRGEWQGYKVYSPETEDGEIAYTGLPVMILVKDGKWRLTEGKEIFDCYHAVTKYRFYKKNPSDKVWWVDMGEDVTGILAISFDKEKIYYLYRDYNKMTDEEKAIFNSENPFWDEFFNGKKGK